MSKLRGFFFQVFSLPAMLSDIVNFKLSNAFRQRRCVDKMFEV